MARTKKVLRNNSKNKLGGASASASPSRRVSRRVSRSLSPSSKKEEQVVIISAVKDVPGYFTESKDQVKKLITVGNRIKKLTLKYKDDSPSEIYEFNESLNHEEFKTKLTEHANLAGEQGLEGITVSLEIENNFKPRRTPKTPIYSDSKKDGKDILEKIRLLVNQALIINQESTSKSTLTLDMDQLANYKKRGEFSFYFNDDAYFNVTTVSKDKYYKLVEDLSLRSNSNSNSNSNSPRRAESDPGPRSRKSKSIRRISSTRSNE